jgi:hypothetical protein
MIINYGLREDNTFDFWQVYPIEDNLPKLEIEDPRVIKLGITKLINGNIVQPTPQETSIDVIEKNIGRFRGFRKKIFEAFDIWEKNVLRGREQDNQEVINWYNQMLAFTNNITEDTKIIDYPTVPEVIKKYV